MSKNRGAATFVVILIFFVIVLFFLFSFSMRIADYIKENAHAADCKASVAVLSRLGIHGKGVKQYNINCPVKNIRVTKEEEVFPTIAREMATVWSNFGAGKLELFAPEDGVFCVLGSHITFPNWKKELHGFLPYLAEHAYKKTTYLEYLTGFRLTPAEAKSVQELHTLDKIDTSKPLGILFVYSKDAHLTKEEVAVFGLGAGTLLGTAAGVVSLFYFPPHGVVFLGMTIITPLVTTAARVITSSALTAVAGAKTGYLLGYDESAEWDARILAVPFAKEEIAKLPCTYWPVPVK